MTSTVPRRMLAGCFLAGMAALATAEETLRFLEGPAQWIATKEEKKEFAALTSEAAAKAWVELFWARRDPDLTTAVNEFKVEFDQRVAAADQAFGWEKQRGAMTDRGRTLIVMGPPRAAENFSSGNRTQTNLGSPGWVTEETDRQGEGEVWEYRGEQIPKAVKAQQVLFLFTESRPGLGDFVLNRAERRNATALKLLAEAPQRTLLHPKLTEVPRLGLVAGSKAASAQQLAIFEAEVKPWPEGAQVLVREGVMSALWHPVWVHIFLPDPVPPADEAVGRARGGPSGGTFAVAANPLSVAGGHVYQYSIPVEAGSWEVDVALLKAGVPLAVTTAAITTEKAPEQGTYISPFFWGVDVRQEIQARLGDPFNIGGWRVLPRPDNLYTTDESLAYFCFVVRPPVGPEGHVSGELTLNLFFGERKVAELPTQNVSFSQISEGLWMMGSSLPLSGFRRPGDYRLEITLKELASGVSKTIQVPMTVRPAAGAAAGGS